MTYFRALAYVAAGKALALVAPGRARYQWTPLQSLTRREREILDQLTAGLTNRQIAEQLYISPRTAAVHVSSVLRKLGVTDRIQAARLARKLHGH